MNRRAVSRIFLSLASGSKGMVSVSVASYLTIARRMTSLTAVLTGNVEGAFCVG
ncbi:MAG: hypothetical protein ACI8QF_004287, partial [Limisphaerales bacterium]